MIYFRSRLDIRLRAVRSRTIRVSANFFLASEETPCTDPRYLLLGKLGPRILNGQPYIIANEESWLGGGRGRGGGEEGAPSNRGLPTRRQLRGRAASNFITAGEMGQTGHTPPKFPKWYTLYLCARARAHTRSRSLAPLFFVSSFEVMRARARAHAQLSSLKPFDIECIKKDNEYFGR